MADLSVYRNKYLSYIKIIFNKNQLSNNMKKSAFILTKQVVFYAMHLTFLIGFILLNSFTVRSQNIDKTLTTVSNQTANNNAAVIPQITGKHAPDPNAPDFEVKKREWIKNYPNEYKYSQSQNNNHSNSNQPQKNALHAPYYNDPDYAAKKAEWIKNYPQEYQQWLDQKRTKKKDNNN